MILQLPSPVQQISDPLFEQKGLEVYVKRDDLIHPLISGNKWRKLKYILESAKKANKTHLVTFGGAFSNHLLATAAAANYFSFSATGIVRGEAVENETLNTCQNLGMKLVFIDRDTYRDKQSYFDSHFNNDPEAYFIDEGGASAEAIEGCAELVAELTETYHHLFCAAGTGTTAAGIYAGLRKHHLKTKLHTLPVIKNGGFLKEEITQYISIDEEMIFHLDYHTGGYAKTTPELLKFIINFYSKTNILLDPVYTGKLVFGLYDLIKKDYFQPGEKILWIHTGGLLGLLGMRNKFEELEPDFKQIFDQMLQK